MKDLSEIHVPVTGLFGGGDGRNYELSSEQAEFFKDNGYLAGVRVLDDGQIEALRYELEDLMRPEQAENPLFYEYHHNESEDPDKTLFHALGAWRVSPAFHDLLFHKAVTVPAAQLLDGPVRFWHDQLFVKPARDGGVVAWHQDYSYWTRTKPIAHLTCWIGLDDSNEDNGCVHYVPRSHRWNLLRRTNLANDMDAILDDLTPEQRAEFRPVPIVLRKGEASFHHPLMLHGSFENRSDRPRRAVVLNMLRDGVVSASNEPLLADIPSIKMGNTISGQFFPLLS